MSPFSSILSAMIQAKPSKQLPYSSCQWSSSSSLYRFNLIISSCPRKFKGICITFIFSFCLIISTFLSLVLFFSSSNREFKECCKESWSYITLSWTESLTCSRLEHVFIFQYVLLLFDNRIYLSIKYSSPFSTDGDIFTERKL